MKKKTAGFEKFMSKELKGSAKKEHFRQEKKKVTKERKEFFEKKRAEEAAKKDAERAKRFDGPRSKSGAANTKTEEGPRIVRAQVTENMPLNKYLAHCGICSRRDAAEIVKTGKVQVNGQVVTEPGFKVARKDEVKHNGKKVTPTKDLVYILLNKPKDYLTTTDDPQKRKTVLDLIQHATKERVYPVGRLDRNTSGVLLLTNDGDLAQKLTHPSNEIKKLYAVTLDKPLTKAHFDEILKGVPLEDGVAHVDVLAYTDNADKTQIGIELHTGRNRIVRRIFEHYGYDVKNLDRVIFAGLTKKNVQRGKWRFLSEKEVRDLKYFKRGKA
jgi:23S rRNA pseudouridine2605 synthase